MGKARLRKSLRILLDQKVDKPRLIPAELGAVIKGVQQVKVPNRVGFVYARIRGSDSEIVQAFNETTNYIYGLPVLLRKDKDRYYVEGRDISRYDTWTGGYSNLAPHGRQHSMYGGDDIVWIHKKQFTPLGVYPYSGTFVRVNEDWLMIDDQYIRFTGTVLNLSNLKPGVPEFARFVTIYYDTNAQSIAGITGSTFSIAGGIEQNVPLLSASQGIPLGAVFLYGGQKNITFSDIYDIRPIVYGKSTYGIGFANKLYTNTKSFIQSLLNAVTGSVGFAYNTRELGIYRSANWIWYNTGSAGLSVYDDGTFVGTVDGLDFGSGLGVSITGTKAYVDLFATEYSTYVRYGTPIPLGSVTGTYWKIPYTDYATGTLGVFIGGVAQTPGTDFLEQFPMSGTYQLFGSPPTGVSHAVIWGNRVPSYIGATLAKMTGCRVRRTSDQSIPNDTVTAVSWDTEDIDEANYFDSSSPTRFTIPEAGWYLVTYFVDFAWHDSGIRYLYINSNGSTSRAIQTLPVSNTRGTISLVDYYDAGDYIECKVYQSSGGALNIELARGTIFRVK